jgi:hypothetical protein
VKTERVVTSNQNNGEALMAWTERGGVNGEEHERKKEYESF